MVWWSTDKLVQYWDFTEPGVFEAKLDDEACRSKVKIFQRALKKLSANATKQMLNHALHRIDSLIIGSCIWKQVTFNARKIFLMSHCPVDIGHYSTIAQINSIFSIYSNFISSYTLRVRSSKRNGEVAVISLIFAWSLPHRISVFL